MIAIYGDIPTNCDFTHPRHVPENVKWGVIKSVGGQRPRVAGYFMDEIFHVVFLDAEHRFYIVER